MIKEVIMYTVVCDCCGKDINDGEDYAAWSDKGFAEDSALECGCIKIDGKHYCNNCWEWDEQGDNQIPKQKTNP